LPLAGKLEALASIAHPRRVFPVAAPRASSLSAGGRSILAVVGQSLRFKAAKTVEPGKLLLVWSGWGEETMIAGRWLRQKARLGELPSKSFRLFVAEQGQWLQQDPLIATYVISSAPSLSFTENDYYLVNRAAIMAIDFDFLKEKNRSGYFISGSV